MRRVCGRISVAVVVIVLLGNPAALASEPAASDSVALYFPETGFWVDATFAAYWETHGSLALFGYPITREFYQDGFHRQYFERAIFERHEDAAGTSNEVRLVDVGTLRAAGRGRNELPFQRRDPASAPDADWRYFAQTGHLLGGVFRSYWEQHDGPLLFGEPISDAFIEPGSAGSQPRTVQYFERARFEYDPELGDAESGIRLAPLGREVLAGRDVPPIALERQSDSAADRDSGPLGPLPIGEPSNVACGFNYLFWTNAAGDQNNKYFLDLAAAAGCDWMRIPFPWSDLQPTPDADISDRIWPYERIVSLAEQRGLRLMINVARPPAWARPDDPAVPADPAAYAAFMQQLAGHFKGRVEAYQLWNEPNLAEETNGRVDPLGFAPLVSAAYAAVKQADPDALVVLPGLAPTSVHDPIFAVDDVWYLRALLQRLSEDAGAGPAPFDVLGIQAYGAGNAPDTYWPGNAATNPGWTEAPEFYFRHAEELRSVAVEQGFGDTPVWIGEFGWPVGNYAHVFGYGAWITYELQAAYLARAYEIMRTEWHWVDLAFVWHLNAASFGPTAIQYTGFSITDEDGVTLPAYLEIQAIMLDE